MRLALMILFCCFAVFRPVLAEEWTPEAKALLAKVRDSKTHDLPPEMRPVAVPMENGRSFFLVWTPEGEAPARWIVSMPGTDGLVSDEMALWVPGITGRRVGLVEVQWWLGGGETPQDYLTPFEIYRELSMLLPKIGVTPGHALLHGFSRGSANIYTVAALDRNKGQKFFDVVVANSGGASLDYPPTHDVDGGRFGQVPFKGTKWVTVCGYRDPHPERDGCPAMQRTAAWLQSKGGVVAMAIEDENAGHGALHTNPANTNRLLDWYLAD